MKLRYFFFYLLLIITCICAQSVFAQGSLQLSSDLKLGKMFGSTKCHIHVQEYIPIYYGSTPFRVDSELEFPLDPYIGEISLRGQIKFKEKYEIGINWGGFKNINDPYSKMKDSDWASLPMFGEEVKFSYTESDAEATIWGWDATGEIGYSLSDQIILSALGGYKYMKMDYEILGVHGWQLDGNSDKVYFDLHSGENILDYDVTFKMPCLGVGLCILDVIPKLDLNVNYLYSANTDATDYDDHILRNKESRSICTGDAHFIQGNLNWDITKNFESPLKWTIGADLENMRIATTGKQRQEFYDDDPGTPDYDETGLVNDDIDNKIDCNYMKLMLSFKCLF